jgi:aldose 1-epimerase
LLGTYEIHNPGASILPWGLGTHPYFRVSLGSAPSENAVVSFPVQERWELHDMLPTGARSRVPEAVRFAQGVPFAGLQLDDVFTGLTKVNGDFVGTVYDPETRRRTSIRFGEPFGECVVFIPPHREAICIEPYSCVSNAYELRERGIATGLQELAPEGTYSTSVEIMAEQLDS